jgi:hypothetical protein
MAQGDKIIGYGRRNRRRDKRRAMACRVVAGAGRLATTTKNISLGGFAAPEPLPGLDAGAIIPVELEAPGGRWIAVDAMVVRNADDFAAAFQGLTPQTFRDIERLMAAPLRALDRSHRLVSVAAGA